MQNRDPACCARDFRRSQDTSRQATEHDLTVCNEILYAASDAVRIRAVPKRLGDFNGDPVYLSLPGNLINQINHASRQHEQHAGDEGKLERRHA